jgi:hypothetical protein
MALYYDLVLGLIPLVMAGVTGALVLTGVTLTTAIPIGGLVALGLIGHAMFVRAPVSSPATQSVQSDGGEIASAD